MVDPDSSPETIEPPLDEAPLSLADLEKEINSVDPEFNQSLQELTAIKGSQLDASLDLEEDIPTIKGEKIKWNMQSGLLKYLKIVFPFIYYLTFSFRWILFKIKLYFTNLRVQIVYRFSQLGPQTIEFAKKKIPELIQNIKKPVSHFLNLKTPEKLSILGFTTFTILSIAVVTWFLKTDILKDRKDPFMLSMEELSSAKFIYEPGKNMESFYASSRVSQNVLSFPKIIANIRPSKNSESNPMIATEFYFEGFSPEVMIELKDREAEVKDLMINLASLTDYDTLSTPEGKLALLEKIKQKVNGLLTQGQIRKVYLKNIVIKP